MKKYLYIGLITLMGIKTVAQSVDKTENLNGITLGVNQSEFEEDLFFNYG